MPVMMSVGAVGAVRMGVVMVVMALAVARSVPEVLDDRPVDAAGALGLEGRVGDVVTLKEQLFDLS